MGLCARLRLLHRHDVHPARGPAREAPMMGRGRLAAWGVGLAALGALPFVYRDPYPLHILVLILIWSFAYTSWSMMGRVGPVSPRPGGVFGERAPVPPLPFEYPGGV